MPRRTMENTWPFQLFAKGKYKGGMWLQTKGERGYGANGNWVAEKDRVYVDPSRGKFTDPLVHAVLDIMERDLGGYPDRHDPLGILFVVGHENGGGTQGGGQAHVNRGRSGTDELLGVTIQVPYLNCGLAGVTGRSFKPPLKTVQEFDWAVLSPHGFEELVYRLYEGMPEYKDVEWLQKTNDADAGRDISAVRVKDDKRIMIQCKHQKASISTPALSNAVNDAMTWNPKFDEVIFVTTTAFSEKAIRWAESHNANLGGRPPIKLESEGHVRVMVSKQPSLIAHLPIRK